MIISYDLNNFQKINELKEPKVLVFRHIFDKYKKRDLILSATEEKIIKVWSFNNFECLFKCQVNYQNIYSVCFLDNNKQIFILASSFHDYGCTGKPHKIKVFDLNGNKIKEINDSKDQTRIIDYFYDNKLLKFFIITGNTNYVKSFDFNKNKIYHKYYDKTVGSSYLGIGSIIIDQKNYITKIIHSDYSNSIRIWDFHSGKLLKKYNNFSNSYGLCLLNEKYLLVGNYSNIKILDLEEEKIINDKNNNDYENPKNDVVNIKKNSSSKIRLLYHISYDKQCN